MGYTKGDLVEAALTEIGIAGDEFDVVPEQMEKDMRRLDSMMAEWVNQGILLSYPTNSSPNTSEEGTDSNIPDIAIEAVVTNLALRLAPSYGKQVQPDTRITAKNSMTYLVGVIAKPLERRLPGMPKGAGYKNTRYPFTVHPEDRTLELVEESFDPSGGSSGT